MRLRRRRNGHRRVLELDGPLGDDTANQLVGLLAGRNRLGAIDLRRVSTVNSAGVEALVECALALDARGGSLTLLSVRPDVASQLLHLGLADLFRVHRSAGSLSGASVVTEP